MIVRPFHTSLVAEHELPIGKFRFYKNMVIGEVYEGVNITYDSALPFFALVMDYYQKDTPLVYISDRKNSYSVDPTMYYDAQKLFSNIVGYATIVYDDRQLKVARLEGKFHKLPSAYFDSKDKALAWAIHKLEDAKEANDKNSSRP